MTSRMVLRFYYMDKVYEGECTIMHGGKLVVRTGTEFTVPSGGLVNMDHGEIKRSGDFFPCRAKNLKKMIIFAKK